MRVGFIGLGNMGRLMAGRIAAAGFPLTVYDVRAEAIAPLVEKGARAAQSPAEVARSSDVVCLCLPGPVEAEECVLGSAGVIEVREGSIVVDHTTNAPSLSRRLHAALAEKQAAMLDAPVSGGITGAANGTLTMQVGGDAAVLDRCRPVLESMASTILHVGQIGAGGICKLTHNCAVFCADLAMMECMTMGIQAGVDAGVMVEVFQKSGIGRNHDLQVSLPATLFQGAFEPARFSLRTAMKDMKLAIELARSSGVAAPMAELCAQEMAEAMARGWADRDHAIYLTLQEERAGVKVRVK